MKAIKTGAFKGATMFEAYIGRLWGTFLRPKYWCKRNMCRLIRIGWEKA